MWFPRPPTRAEVYVLLAFGAVVFFALGVFFIVWGITAPADKHDFAPGVIRYGIFCMLFAITLIIALVVGKRMIDG
ncbi:MAG TPA: hypothetical protein VGM66_04660 [Candidatus Udaeobacter sp.]|jgi:hypothetical protein